MTDQTQHGYLLLADITGYTSYLSKVELDHAQGILTDLLEAVVQRVKLCMTLSKLEGDAVFAYAPETFVPSGERIFELVEDIYMAFRDRVDAIHRRTTCECRACQAIPTLDLKFFVHHGDYILQHIAGITELLGSDVNLAHRLMKNHISETTGWRAYALFTENALKHIEYQPDGLHPQVENYEHLGDIQTYSYDLHPRYEALLETRHTFIKAEEADLAIAVDYPVPPAVLWDWLNDPAKIILWSPNRYIIPGLRPAGRIGVGAQNHCMHGKKVTMIETVLDWKPFRYFTVRQDSKMIHMDFLVTNALEPLGENSSRLQYNLVTKFHFPLPKWLATRLGLLVVKMFKMDAEYFVLQKMLKEQNQFGV
jgi:hypothetical protein